LSLILYINDNILCQTALVFVYVCMCVCSSCEGVSISIRGLISWLLLELQLPEFDNNQRTCQLTSPDMEDRWKTQKGP